MNTQKRDLNATKSALLAAAEKLLSECPDPSEVTSRAITKEAGVNLAMINYCFGSREALFFEVFEGIKKRAAETNPRFLEIANSSLSPKEQLIEIYFESLKLMLKYFNCSKAVIQYVLLNRPLDAERKSLKFIKDHFGDRKTDSECRLIAYELSSVHELLVMKHEDIKKSCGIDLNDDATLKRMIEENINKYLD